MNQSLVALHLLKSLAVAQARGRVVTLETLCEGLGLRRAEARAALSSLHREGYVDVGRMKLSLSGLAIASGLARTRLAPLRPARLAVAAA